MTSNWQGMTSPFSSLTPATRPALPTISAARRPVQTVWPCARSRSSKSLAPVGSTMAGITCGIISMAATFFLRLARASTAWIPMSPAPITAACRTFGMTRSMLMESCRVMQG